MIDRSTQHWPATMTKTLDVCPNCPTCGHPMLDGDVVTMDWSGVPLNHVSCPSNKLDAK